MHSTEEVIFKRSVSNAWHAALHAVAFMADRHRMALRGSLLSRRAGHNVGSAGATPGRARSVQRVRPPGLATAVQRIVMDHVEVSDWDASASRLWVC